MNVWDNRRNGFIAHSLLGIPRRSWETLRTAMWVCVQRCTSAPRMLGHTKGCGGATERGWCSCERCAHWTCLVCCRLRTVLRKRRSLFAVKWAVEITYWVVHCFLKLCVIQFVRCLCTFVAVEWLISCRRYYSPMVLSSPLNYNFFQEMCAKTTYKNELHIVS